MLKEADSLQQLEARRDKLSKVLEHGNTFIGNRVIRSREMKERADPTDFKATENRGKYNLNTSFFERMIGGVRDTLVQFDEDIQPNQLIGIARDHLEQVRLGREELITVCHQVADGIINEKDLETKQLQFEELNRKPTSSMLLQRGLDLLTTEESEEEVEVQTPINQVPSIIDLLAPEIPPFILDDQIITGKQAQILHILTSASEEQPVNNPELLDKIFPSGEEEVSKKKLADLKNSTIVLIKGKGLVLRHAYSTIQTSDDSEPVTIFTGYYIEPVSLDESRGMDEEKKSYVEGFIETLPQGVRTLLAKVRESEDFRIASDVLKKYKDEPEATIKELRSYIAGYLFESVAYLHLKEILKRQGKILLSPKECFEIFRLLYPEKKLIEFPFGLQHGIEGVSVPDGIVLELSKNSTKIVGSCEYSLTTVRDTGDKEQDLEKRAYWFDKNINSLESKEIVRFSRIGNYLKSLYPKINDAFISPEKKVQYIVLPDPLTFPSASGTLVNVPVIRGMFRAFLDATLKDVRENQGVSNI